MRIYTTAMTLGEDAFGRQALRSKLLHLLARDTLLRYFLVSKKRTTGEHGGRFISRCQDVVYTTSLSEASVSGVHVLYLSHCRYIGLSNACSTSLSKSMSSTNSLEL